MGAQAFNDAWSAAMAKLFGTEADPQGGVLSRIANHGDLFTKRHETRPTGNR